VLNHDLRLPRDLKQQLDHTGSYKRTKLPLFSDIGEPALPNRVTANGAVDNGPVFPFPASTRPFRFVWCACGPQGHARAIQDGVFLAVLHEMVTGHEDQSVDPRQPRRGEIAPVR